MPVDPVPGDEPGVAPTGTIIGPIEVFLGDDVVVTLTLDDPAGTNSWTFALADVPVASTLASLSIDNLTASFTPDATGTYLVTVELSDGVNTRVLEFSVTVISGLPDAPSGPNPADSASGVGIAVGLDWDEATGATSYEVYLGLRALPDTPTATVTDSTYTPPSAFAYSASYTWQVVAINTYGATPGPVWKFDTQDEPLSPPAVPSGPSPSDGAAGLSRDIDLDWDDATDAASYSVRYREVGGSWTDANGITSSAFALPQLLFDTEYEWQVTAENAAGSTDGPIWSLRTIVQRPGTFSLVGPADAAADQDVELQLDWTNAARADEYDVYFGTSADPPLAATTASSQLGRTGLSRGTTYYWRVVAKNAGGTRSIGPFSFSTLPNPPGTPANPAPEDTSSGQAVDATLSWDAIPGATSYEVYLDTNEVPGKLVDTVSAPAYDPGGLSYSQTYFWQIIAVNSGGSTAGDVWSFTVQQEPPAAFSLSSPKEGETGVDIRSVMLDWTDSARAEEYDLYYGVGSLPAEPSVTVTSSQHTVPSLSRGTTYLWRVVARNAGGETGTATGTFRTQLNVPSQPSAPTPADGAVDALPALTLDWADSQYATSYDVEYRFGRMLEYEAIATDLTSSSYTVPGDLLDYDTTYRWRVIAKNEEHATTGPEWVFRTQSNDVASALAGYWSFDGTIADTSPSAHSSIWYPQPALTHFVPGAFPVYVPNRNGVEGQAVAFGAANSQYIRVPLAELPSSLLNNHISGFSLSLWFDANGSNELPSILTKNVGDGSSYELRFEDATGLVFRSDAATDVTVSGALLSDGWNHLVISWDFATDQLRVWVNGSLEHDVTAAPFTNSTNDLYIGAGQGGFFTGSVDELRVYYRAISEIEAGALFEE